VTFLSNDAVTDLNPKTVSELSALGFENAGATLVPNELYSLEAITSGKGLIILIVGGLLVGISTRYADSCTSGQAITGLSSLQKPSLIAVIGFFIVGLIMTNFILPLLFYMMKFIKFLLVGVFFGIVLVKSEAVSWYRIYEMFRFQSFHMYGIIGTAVACGVLFYLVSKKGTLKSSTKQNIFFPLKENG